MRGLDRTFGGEMEMEGERKSLPKGLFGKEGRKKMRRHCYLGRAGQ